MRRGGNLSGLKPRGFTWVIAGRLAVSERIGGYGLHHRRVRREEEILWLSDNGVTAVLSLLETNHNLAAYEAAGLRALHVQLPEELEQGDVDAFFKSVHGVLIDPEAALLVHGDNVDDRLVGLMGGYLVFAGLIEDPIVATATIQEILRRPLGPEGRKLIPDGVV